MKDVFDEIVRVLARGEKAALATIVSSRGSLPMSKKAKMLVREDGTFVGTVGGGCLEADVWAEAKNVMATEIPSLQRFILTEKHAGDEGLNCGGNAEIFTEPILPGRADIVYSEVSHLVEQRADGILATLVSGSELRAGEKILIHSNGDIHGTFGDVELDSLVQHQAVSGQTNEVLRILTLDHRGEEIRVFLESVQSTPKLFVFGGGHVSKAISSIASSVGFHITVIDDRPAFANQERFPEADELVVEDFEGVVGRLPIDSTSYVIAVTRGHQWDQPIIEQAVWTRARYIGMIGSRRKVALMWKKLEEKGIPSDLLNRVHAPIGLKIGADTPEEIAVSIVSELIKVRRAAGKPTHSIETKATELTDSV